MAIEPPQRSADKGIAPEPEFEPDAWERFEKAVDKVTKAPPKPKKTERDAGGRKKRDAGS